MSSFYVGDKQVSRLTNYMYKNTHKFDISDKEKANTIIADLAGIPSTNTINVEWLSLSNYQQKKIIASHLRNLSVAALQARYPETYRKMIPDTFSYDEDVLYPSDLQAYFSIRCFLYQCNESEILANLPVYKAVEHFKELLAIKIANDITDQASDAGEVVWE